VHGRDDARKLAVHGFLRDVTTLEAVILRDQVNAGRTIIEKFEDHAADAAFAVVILTADDKGGLAGTTPTPRPRQNVSFEFGFFVAALAEIVSALGSGMLASGGVERLESAALNLLSVCRMRQAATWIIHKSTMRDEGVAPATFPKHSPLERVVLGSTSTASGFPRSRDGSPRTPKQSGTSCSPRSRDCPCQGVHGDWRLERQERLLGALHMLPDQAVVLADINRMDAVVDEIRAFHSLEVVSFIGRSSLLPSSDIRLKYRRMIRFFHIDGGHSCAGTYADLAFASEMVGSRALVAIDDFGFMRYPQLHAAVISSSSPVLTSGWCYAVSIRRISVARKTLRSSTRPSESVSSHTWHRWGFR
jgi:hypothetical protein